MDIGDLSVSHLVNVSDKISHSLYVVRDHSDPVVENVIDRHDRDAAVDQFDHFRIPEVDTRYRHTVQSSVSCPFQVSHGTAVCFTAVDQCQIIVPELDRSLEAVQHMGEEVVCQAALGLVHKEDSYIM